MDWIWLASLAFAVLCFVPRASERRVLLKAGACYTSSHVHIFITFSHLLIFTPSHLLIFTSSHLLNLTSSHLHSFSPSHPHIFTHLLSLSLSSHLHIFSSSHLLFLSFFLSLSLLPSVTVSLLLFLFSLRAAGSADEAPQHGHPFARNGCQKLKKNCDLTTSAANLWHAMRFECQNHFFFGGFGWSGGIPFARNEGRVSKTEEKLRFNNFRGNLFARNDVRVSTTEEKLRFNNFRGNPLARNAVRVSKPFFFGGFGWSGGIPFARNEGRVSKTEEQLRFNNFRGNLFARNDVRVSKTEEKLRFNDFCGNPSARNEVRASKAESFLRVWLVRRQL